MTAHTQPQDSVTATHPTKGFFVGAQNDAWFIIYGEKPAGTSDQPNHEADRTAVAKVYDEALARNLCDLANGAALAKQLVAHGEFFAYHSESGAEFFDTDAKARTCCDGNIEYEREGATNRGDWNDDAAESIRWGIVLGRAKAVPQPGQEGDCVEYQMFDEPGFLLASKVAIMAKQHPNANRTPAIEISSEDLNLCIRNPAAKVLHTNTATPSDNAALKEMWALMSEMVELHGMNGDNTMTDDQHARWQQAAGLAHDQLRTSGSEGAAATDA